MTKLLKKRICKKNKNMDKRINLYGLCSQQIRTTPIRCKRAYFLASATVEASLVVPLFIYAVMTVAYLIYVLSIKVHISQALYNDTRQIARYAYLSKVEESDLSKGILYIKAQSGLIDNIGKDYAKTHHIAGGNAGLIMLESKIMENNYDITLVVRYAVKNPFDIFGIGIISVVQSNTSKAWLGEDGSKYCNDEDEDKIVYITENGSVYHENRNCTYLNPSIKEVLFESVENCRNLSGAKYYACERCESDLQDAQVVYITNYGNRYHLSKNCSELRRVILEVKLSKLNDRRPCSKCCKSN